MPDPERPEESFKISSGDLEDYEFLAAEIERYAQLPPDEQIRAMFADPWNSINGLKADDGRTFYLSREANNRFPQVVTRGLKHLGDDACKHSAKELEQVLRREFLAAMLQGFEITRKNAHDLFVEAVQKLESTYKSLTYLVPCSAVVERSYADFTIGPVNFVLCDEYLRSNESAIKCALDEAKHPDLVDKLFTRIHTFYSEYQWIACITVPPCNADESRRRARLGVQRALDVLKLIIGSSRGSGIKEGYDVAIPAEFAELVSPSPGTFSFRLGGSRKGATTNERWYEQLKRHPAWRLLTGVLYDAWNSLNGNDEIRNRFLDALSWHSDALSERDVGASVVKFWTAIERLVSTSPGSNIAARAGVLSSAGPKEFFEKSKKFEGLYQKRSDVVHGRANRNDEPWYLKAASASEEVSKNTLFQYLYSMEQIRSYQAASDRKKLTAWLDELDLVAKRYRKQFTRDSTFASNVL